MAKWYGVPFLVADSVAGNTTARGFKSTFRVTPIAGTSMQFLPNQNQASRWVQDIAIVNETTDYGTSVGDAIAAEAKKTGFTVSSRVPALAVKAWHHSPIVSYHTEPVPSRLSALAIPPPLG